MIYTRCQTEFSRFEKNSFLIMYMSVLRGNFQQKSSVGTWKSVRLKKVSVYNCPFLWFFYEKHTYVLPGHVEVSVLERCQSYGKSVLRGFTVCSYKTYISLHKTLPRQKECFYSVFLRIGGAQSNDVLQEICKRPNTLMGLVRATQCLWSFFLFHVNKRLMTLTYVMI